MRKASLWIAGISILYAVLPLLSVLVAGVIANMYGCNIDESGLSTCPTPIGDIGDLLSIMGIAGWLVFFTVPTGLLGLAVALILFVISFFWKGKSQS